MPSPNRPASATRVAPRLLLTFGLAGGMLLLPTVPAPAAEPRPVAPRVQTIDASGVDAASLRDPAASATRAAADAPEVLTAVQETEPFTLAGVSWPSDAPVSQVQVRLREQGTWSGWETLPVIDEGPDAGTDEYEASADRIGTSPLLSDGADGVQVRVDTTDGSRPTGVEVSLIDPGTSAADPTVAGQAAPVGAADAAATQPRIVTRAQWGADERLSDAGPQRVNETIRTLVLHHTAGSNSYSQAQAVSQLRGVYAYHTVSLGWSDMGYNMVVDRYGTIYEGRRGSISSAIQGAHAGGFNRDTYGVSVMGNFVGVDPPPAVVRALNEVIGWKLGQYGVDPQGTSVLTSAGGGTSKYAAGSRVTLPNVIGHRDVGSTSCPGNLYSYLPQLRTAATALAAATPADLRGAFPRDFTGDRVADIVAVDSAGRLLVYRGDGSGGFAGVTRIGHGWGGIDLVTQVGDWDGDGFNDLIARERATNRLRVYLGDGAGAISGSVLVGSGWGGMVALIGMGDMNRDGRRDLLGRHRDGTLWRYLGDGRGGFAASTQIGSGFAPFTLVGAAGDFDDDGDPDLVARAADGTLLLYPGSPTGTFGSKRTVGTGWNGMSSVQGTGSWDRRTGGDLLAVTSTGVLRVYSGNADGGVATVTQIGRGWASMRLIP